MGGMPGGGSLAEINWWWESSGGELVRDTMGMESRVCRDLSWPVTGNVPAQASHWQ